METKKYIIEIPDNTAWLQWVKVSDKDGHVYFDFKDPEDLTPYTEPDTEKVRKEAKEEGYSIGYDEGREAGVQQGLNDAWDAARKIVLSTEDGGLFDYDVRKSVFGCGNYMVLKRYSASEAIKKIRQYEQEQEEQEKLPTVEDVMRQYLHTFCRNRICSDCPLYTSEFTCGRGNHFCTNHPVSDEEVRRAYAKVLRKMKGSEE